MSCADDVCMSVRPTNMLTNVPSMVPAMVPSPAPSLVILYVVNLNGIY
jgi:hypothetical protein